MKAYVHITTEYGGLVHMWQLIVSTPKHTRAFFLGQDVKFCERVLGISTRDVVSAIGGSDIYTPKMNKRLAKFICKQLDINGRNMTKFQSWSFSVQ